MKVFYITFGCKVNSYETEAMREILLKAGFDDAASRDDADIFVINSCTVTSESDSKLMQTLRRIKRDNPSSIIVLTGCYAQAHPKKARDIPFIDITIGTRNRLDMIKLLNDFIEKRKRLEVIPNVNAIKTFEPLYISSFDGHTRAFIKIQDGCSRRCSYCIIPHSRGRVCSRPLDDIKKEVTHLANSGYHEIVFVGINLAFYGVDIGYRLVDAVEAIADIDGVERIRLSSLEPEMISDEDLQRLARVKQFCPSFHLSLQSGCDRTLKAMKRHYTASEYEELVNRIRAIFPLSAITTDVMTGFPQETIEDHVASMEFVKKIGFADIHVFPYSQREGTVADAMSEQVPIHIRKQRANEMITVGNKCRENYLKQMIGSTVPVLFEREKDPLYHGGYAPNYAYVKVLAKSGDKSLRNSILNVKIEGAEKDYCIATIVENA